MVVWNPKVKLFVMCRNSTIVHVSAVKHTCDRGADEASDEPADGDGGTTLVVGRPLLCPTGNI